MLRRSGLIFVVLVLLLALAPTAHARPYWKVKIDRIVGGRAIGVAVADEGRTLYRNGARKRRVPASNQKLLMSMALLDALAPEVGIATSAEAGSFFTGVVAGDLWIKGEGDPAMSAGRSYAEGLSFEPTRVRTLARALVDAGLRHIEGSVVGSTSYFGRDWWAPGWKDYFPSRYIAFPTALTFEGNVHKGQHTDDPELLFARALTRRLKKMGVTVSGPPASGRPPTGLVPIAQVESQPLSTLVAHMNHQSSNFFAEVLGKRLGVETYGGRGTIAKGAAATAKWAAEQGVSISSYDASGLSYSNRVSPRGIVRLLGVAEDELWGEALRASLPGADQGTLEDRLSRVRVRAKTGTLIGKSALSGWVWLRRTGSWAEFSILSHGLSKSVAVDIEDRIVRTLTRYAR